MGIKSSAKLHVVKEVTACITTAASPWRYWRMDGRGSSSTSTALAAVSIVLILLYLLWRFVWQAKKQGTSSGTTAASPSSSSSAPQPSWPSRVAAPCLGAGEAAARRVLPVFVVHVEATKDGSGAEKADCAVCLGELGVGDQAAARLVPGCGHGFHAECIEAWFRVNSTCPLCRATVAAAGHATGRA
ncbi:hypothetical protein EJB05_06711, partial [Eragrostis curvula]